MQEEGTVASDEEEDFLYPLGVNRDKQEDAEDDEALLQPLDIGTLSPQTRRSKRNAARFHMQTSLGVGASEGHIAASREASGAAGNHDMCTVASEVQVTAVLHKLLNDAGKEKAVLGNRKRLLRKREAGQAIDEEDLDFVSIADNLNSQDVPIIKFLMDANAFTAGGLGAMWSTLKTLKL